MATTVRKIQVSSTVKVDGGPTTAPTVSLEVEAFDSVQSDLPVDSINKEVEVQPATAGKLLFLLIQSTVYGDDLTYKVDGDTANTVIKLNSPHLFSGTGALELLPAPPNKLIFTNGLTEDVTVTILAGRNAS